jgi:hypothetical protein
MAMFIIALFPLTILLASKLGAINILAMPCSPLASPAPHIRRGPQRIHYRLRHVPEKVVASITGIGGMAGRLAAFSSLGLRA